MLPDPVAAGELQEEGAIEAALHAKVDVFDTGGVAEPGDLEEPGEPPILAGELLPLEDEGEAILEGESGHIRDAGLFLEGLGHTGEAKGMQERERLLHEHEGLTEEGRDDGAARWSAYECGPGTSGVR